MSGPYFTKGIGSNGIDTVYTVSSLPTLANAAAQKISVVPGFPTDSARSTGGDFTTIAGPTYGTVYRGVAYVTAGHDRDGDDH